MEFPQLRINSRNALLGTQIKQAQVSIDAKPAVQTIKQPEADINIKTQPGKLTIDQSKALADVGIFPTRQLIKQEAQEGIQTAGEGVQRRKRQGDQLMKIEHGGNPIPMQAKINSEGPEKQFNIGWIPSPGGVSFNYQPAKVDIQTTPHKPEINVEPQPVNLDYQRGEVDNYLLQDKYLEIDFDNLKYIGINFEMNI